MLRRCLPHVASLIRPLVIVTGLLVTGALDASAAHLEKVVDGLDKPVCIAAAPDDPRLFVVEMAGRIRIIEDGELLPTPFLDISSLLAYDGLFQGLLGLAFHPDYATNGRFYVNYTGEGEITHVSRFEVTADPYVADPGSEDILLSVPQPGYDHNGGPLAFGPDDGYLYVALGDGGFGSDHHENAQNPLLFLGKLLRLDVDVPSGYAIPPDNPFVGEPGYLEEIWAIGIRSPWGMSFDRDSHDLWLADVGLETWEEINFQPAASTGGENYGWSRMEAEECYVPPTDCDTGDLTPPVHFYPHGPGCSVNGGYVYRGSLVPELEGCYLFSDWCTSEIWSFKYDGSTLTELTNRSDELGPPPGDAFTFLVGFGQDAAGELYAIDWHWSGTNEGQIFKIVSDAVDVPSGPTVTPPALLTLTKPQPNPFAEETRFGISSRIDGEVEVSIHDPSGRLVWTDRVTSREGTTTWLEWDGRDARGGLEPSGVYFVKARLGDTVTSQRLYIVR